MNLQSHRLGAEELIELGKPGRAKPLSARKPFFSRGEQRPFLGNTDRGPSLGQLDFLAQIGSFLAQFLSDAFSVLSQIVNVPTSMLFSGVDIVFTNVAGLIRDVPIIGTVAAQIFLIANSIITFGLTIPEELLGGISAVFEGVGKALETLAASKKAAVEKDAKDKLLERTPDPLKDAVSSVLAGNRPSAPMGQGGSQPGAPIPSVPGASSGAASAGGSLDRAIAVGAAVLAGGTLWLLVT